MIVWPSDSASLSLVARWNALPLPGRLATRVESVMRCFFHSIASSTDDVGQPMSSIQSRTVSAFTPKYDATLRLSCQGVNVVGMFSFRRILCVRGGR